MQDEVMKKQILHAINMVNSPEKISDDQLRKQQILSELVDKYGIEHVALAAGLTTSSLKQYLRVKNPSNIGERAVNQAVAVFKLIN